MTLRQEDLNQFIGSQEFFATQFGDVIYTEGVKYMADEGGAYWLIDAIAPYLTLVPSLREHRLLFWKLEKAADGSAVLTAVRDSGLPPIIEQAIPYTDFPLDFVEIWTGWDGALWTIYLPSEH